MFLKHYLATPRNFRRRRCTSDDCRMGNGRFYMGNVNVTQSGIPCQKWDVQSPHTHFQPPDVFPQVQNAENYCRNADAEEPYPWCYTVNSSVRWQWCDVPLCRKLTPK